MFPSDRALKVNVLKSYVPFWQLSIQTHEHPSPTRASPNLVRLATINGVCKRLSTAGLGKPLADIFSIACRQETIPTIGPDTHVPSTPLVQDITNRGEYHRITTVRLKSQADETQPSTPIGKDSRRAGNCGHTIPRTSGRQLAPRVGPTEHALFQVVRGGEVDFLNKGTIWFILFVRMSTSRAIYRSKRALPINGSHPEELPASDFKTSI